MHDYLDELHKRILGMLKSNEDEFVIDRYDLELLHEQWQNASHAAVHNEFPVSCDTCFDTEEVMGDRCEECCTHEYWSFGACALCGHENEPMERD
jgi:hypothetical protein